MCTRVKGPKKLLTRWYPSDDGGVGDPKKHTYPADVTMANLVILCQTVGV